MKGGVSGRASERETHAQPTHPHHPPFFALRMQLIRREDCRKAATHIMVVHWMHGMTAASAMAMKNRQAA